jgi:hypothetical protein
MRLSLSCRTSLLAAALVALPTVAQAQYLPRPFWASLQVQETLSPDSSRCPIPPLYLVGNSQGTGWARYMGPVGLVASDCPIPLSADTPPTGFVFVGGRLTLTADNGGDQLHAAYRGQLNLTTDSPAPTYKLSGSYTVIGGTGCFRFATGGGTLTGSFDLATAQAQYKARGVLLHNPRQCGLPPTFDAAEPTPAQPS